MTARVVTVPKGSPRLAFALALCAAPGCLWPSFDPDLLDATLVDAAPDAPSLDAPHSDAPAERPADARADGVSDTQIPASDASLDATLGDAGGSSGDASGDGAHDASTVLSLVSAMPATVFGTRPGHVVLSGTGFGPGATVTVMGVAAPVLTRVGSTQLTVQAPAFPLVSGAVSVTVTNPGGGSVTSATVLAYRRTTMNFLLGPTTNVCTQPLGVVAADLNGDGVNDLAVACQGPILGNLGVLLGRPGGTFGAMTTYLLQRGGVLAVADVNSDGHPDLVASSELPAQLRVFTNQGPGTFVMGQAVSLPAVAAGLLVVDVNHDTHDDLVVTMPTNGASQLGVLLGSATGTLPALQLVLTSPASALQLPVTADLNHDARPDLVVPDTGANRAEVLLGALAAPFFAAPRPAALTATPTMSVGLGLFDQDDEPDLLAPVGSGQLAFAPGAGDGTFGSARLASLGSTGGTILAASDLDGDGASDAVLLLNASPLAPGRVLFLQGHGDGPPTVVQTLAVPQGPVALAIADLDGDGRRDVVVSCTTSNQLVFLFNRSM